MGALIQTLKNAGELALFHDYRSGTLRDWSGNGNHGTGTDIKFLEGGKGVIFAPGIGGIIVQDSPELRLSEGTLWVLSAMWRYPELSQAILISKRDINCNYSWRYDSVPRFTCYDSNGDTSSLTTGFLGTGLIAVNIRNGEKAEGFVKGLSVGLFGTVMEVTPTDDDLYIGNRWIYERAMNVPLLAAGITNRQLTGDEHAQLVSEVLG